MFQEEIKQLEHLAALGDSQAQYQLGQAYLYCGTITIPKTYEEIYNLAEKYKEIAIPALELVRGNNAPTYPDPHIDLYARSMIGILKTRNASLKEQAAMFIETDVQPYLISSKDDPNWHVDYGDPKTRESVYQQTIPDLIWVRLNSLWNPKIFDIIRSALDKNIVYNKENAPDGIASAEKAKKKLRGWPGPIIAWCDACDAAIEKDEDMCCRHESALCRTCLGF